MPSIAALDRRCFVESSPARASARTAEWTPPARVARPSCVVLAAKPGHDAPEPASKPRGAEPAAA